MDTLESGAEHAVVLIADDDPVTRRLLQHHLQTAAFTVVEATDGSDAIRRLGDDVAVALFDLHMPGASGLECLRHARKHFPDVQVMMVSGQSEIRDAVAAMKEGAIEYLEKPFDPEELVARVRQAAENHRLAKEHRGLRQTVSGPLPPPDYVAVSPISQELLRQVERVASTPHTVLVCGPSGTGKTTLARMIHQRGARSGGPFVAVSCANLPRDLIEDELFGHERGAFTNAVNARPGRAELANKGTLFLDEIGDLPLELQPKLLTFLQDRVVQRLGGNKAIRVDVRVIAATNQDLKAMVEAKTFREDLYYRLAVITLDAPTLAGRRDDIMALANQTLARIARSRGAAPMTLSDSAREALLAHPWPGNIRELENVLERASVFARGTTIQRDDLVFSELGRHEPTPAPTAGGSPFVGLTLEEIERRAVRDTLRACNGNRAQAARMLGVSERTIYNKISSLGLNDG